MENNQHLLEAHTKTKSPKKVFLVIILSIISLSVGFALAWQQLTIMDLSADVSKLEKTQMPTERFESYQDCVNNGGKDLFAGDFSACLGGEVNEGFGNQLYLQYSAQNLPRLTEHEIAKTENRVDGTDKASEELVAFLKEDYTGCEKMETTDGQVAQGYYSVIKEVPNRFALMNYGCIFEGENTDDVDASIIAMKLSDRWLLISPTNHFDETGNPSCLMVDMFRISKEISAQCFQNTGHSNGSLRDVSYL